MDISGDKVLGLVGMVYDAAPDRGKYTAFWNRLRSPWVDALNTGWSSCCHPVPEELANHSHQLIG